MKAGQRQAPEEGGGGVGYPYRPQNTAWSSSMSNVSAAQAIRIGGADQHPVYSGHQMHVDRLYSHIKGSGHPMSEAHLANNSALDWNRHMDKAGISEAVRQQYGKDIVLGVMHKLRSDYHRVAPGQDLGPRGDEGFNNTLNI